MSNEQTKRSGGVGFVGLLTLLFIGLKLTGYINWSWWWVLAPSWICLAIAVLVFAICLIYALFKGAKP